MKPAYLLVPILALAGGRAAASEPAPAESVDLARSHFLRGVQLYRAGAYDAALAEFTRAYDSAPHYRILYNLAQIQAQRQDYVASLGLFRQYLQEGSSELSDARTAQVEREMEELERRIARLHVETNVDGARLFINDRPPVELPLERPLLINAGIHRLRVEKPGYLAVFRTLTLTGGDERSLSIELGDAIEVDTKEAPLRPPLVVVSPAPEAPDDTALWASLTATGVLTTAAVTFGVLTLGAKNELGQQLGDEAAPRGFVAATRERVRTYALLTDAFGIAAATALGASAYFYFSRPDSQEPGEGSMLRAQVGPEGPRLLWSGEF